MLRKDENDLYDDEAIAVYDPAGVCCGRVANSVGEVFRGTCSAGRVYDRFREKCSCIIRFLNEETAIAEVCDDQQ